MDWSVEAERLRAEVVDHDRIPDAVPGKVYAIEARHALNQGARLDAMKIVNEELFSLLDECAAAIGKGPDWMAPFGPKLAENIADLRERAQTLDESVRDLA